MLERNHSKLPAQANTLHGPVVAVSSKLEIGVSWTREQGLDQQYTTAITVCPSVIVAVKYGLLL
jgi:hypothetical protein